MKKQTQPSGSAGRSCGRMAAILVTLLALLWILPSIVLKGVINTQLPSFLQVDAHLGASRLNLFQGQLGLQDLTLQQPEGFGTEPLLELGGIRTRVPIAKAIRGNPITINSLDIEDLTLRLVIDTNGVLNVSRLGPPPSTETEAEIEEPPGPVARILLKDLQVKRFALRVENQQTDQHLEIRDLDVRLSNLSLGPQTADPTRPEIRLESLAMANLDCSMLRGTNALSQVETTDVPERATDKATNVDPFLPGIWLESVTADNFSFTLRRERTDVELALNDFTLQLQDIVMGEVSEAPSRGRLESTGILQGVESRAPLSMTGQMEAFRGEGIPALKLALSLTGFELETIKPIIATDAVKSLGRGLDLNARVLIHPRNEEHEQALGGDWKVLTSAGVTISDDIRGTTEEPDINIMKLLSQILASGTLNAIAGIGGNLAEGAADAVGAVADTGKEAVAGIGKTAMNAGRGLGKAAKGLITLDLKEAKEGVLDTTVGSVTSVVATVKDTATAAGEGLKETAESALGMDENDPWLEGITERAEARAAADREWLSQMEPGE